MWRVWALTATGFTLVGLVVLLISSTPIGLAAARSPQDVKSTMTGVYTAPQATRGEETYMGICVACHPAGTYKTTAFRTAWSGRLLSELFDQVKEKMPKNDPASLTPQEYVQVVAYLLKINGVPAGESELPADSEALKKIRIEMPGDGRH
jgi:S-disulfanyl-L-cysteine oxidoreductase SoxD